MTDDKDDLESIIVYKFDNTKESWHEFSLNFRVIADSRVYKTSLTATREPLMKTKTWTYLEEMMQRSRGQKRTISQPEWLTKRVIQT